MVERIAEVANSLRGRGISIILVEQNLALAETVCDRGYIMEKGSIVFEASSQELRESPVTREKLGV
jgi:branched-chain amino acid transport system ATP-binding protein